MVKDNKIVSIRGQNPDSRFLLPTVLIRLRDASANSIRTVLNQFFDRADDALFELADRARSDVEQTRYFDAMRELRLRRKAMTVTVMQHVSQAFNDIGKFRPKSVAAGLDNVSENSLSLVDHADLEQQVALDNMVSKLRYQHSDALRHLGLRVRHVLPAINVEDDQMPLCPEVLCGGLVKASADLDIDIKAKLVVFKLFDQLLVSSLGEVYRDANQTLISEGVLPDSKAAGFAQASRSRPATAVPPPTIASRDASASDGAPSQEDMSSATFSQLSALLRRGQPAAGVAPPAASAGQWLQTDALLMGLNQVQASSRDNASGFAVPLSEQLQPMLQSESGQALRPGQVDSDVINLVAMLFEFILEDRHLHPVMKSLLGRLQIPLLKVALTDKNFFNRGGHPARKLLNEMALAATGWTEKRPGQRDPLLDKISAIVGQILADFSTDVALFGELLQDFNQFTDLDQRRRDLVEQRLRDAEEGRARHQKATADAQELLRQTMDGRLIPGPVQDMLNGPWAHYLHWLALQDNKDSPAWLQAQDLTEQLIWTIDPVPVTEATRERLQQTIPRVIERLRAALEGVVWDGLSVDTVVRDLELAHLDVFQRLVIAPSESEPVTADDSDKTSQTLSIKADVDLVTGTTGGAEQPPSVANDISGAVTEPAVATSRTLSPRQDPAQRLDAGIFETTAGEAQTDVAEEWLARADALRVGCWLELSRDGSQVRCKLAAFIRAVDKYIFVNRSGAKIAEYKRHELAQLMALGHIDVLDDGLIFDRALESIIDSLRTSRRF